jgi:radical SAM superfamily enzyme YgiQ (UPF0313 family)
LKAQPQSPSSNLGRRLSPGFLVGFSRPFSVKGAGMEAANRSWFPHVRAFGVGDAIPERIVLAAELSAPAGRTVDDIVTEVCARLGIERKRLQRFANALVDEGYLLPDTDAPRWTDAPRLERDPDRTVEATQTYQVPEGSGFLVDGGDFLWFDHGGTLRLRLSLAEMLATRCFGEPVTPDAAWMLATTAPIPADLTREQFDGLVVRLRRSGLLRRAAPVLAGERNTFDPTERNARALVLQGVLDAVAEYRETTMTRPGTRASVIPVNDDHNMAPLALGLLVAYAQELDGGRLRDRYDFVPLFLTEDHTLLDWVDRPAIYLFSNYIWNYERNLKLSALVKEANPRSITIHGGPSTPKYRDDCVTFFAENPHVDVTVRGEGEATFAALLDALDETVPTDLERLRDVEGLSFRAADGEIVETAARDRIADLDTIPSPYLLGLFEPFGRAHVAAVMESNRGCPYGCTFCDWGSATLSRIRKFDMDRVKGELEWFSKNQLLFVSLCDANFGIFERDVEIAEYIAAMKKKYGYPGTAALNYAKNTMKHLRRIIEVFSQAGLTIEPTVALQSMDEHTLKIIKRSNIKIDQYDQLADEFRRAQLPLATDVMMGLPGSTLTSFKSDLQKCTDRDVRARCNPTVLLPNSPMNDPAYREEHGIVAKPHEIVMESKTFSRADFDEMDRLRIAFYVFDNFGVLRHLARFVRSEVGVQEVDFFNRLSRAALAAPLQLPAVASVARMMNVNLAPPSSWKLFVDEVAQFVTAELGVEPGTALDAALAVQLAHLPAADRIMPTTVELPHDYAAWHARVLEARRDDRDHWEQHVPRLASFGPGELKVSDPSDVCRTMVGKSIIVMAWNILSWDMVSPIARGQVVGGHDQDVVVAAAESGGAA